MLRSSAAAGKGGRILAAKQVNPTRMELTRLKKKRITAIRGHKLLKDKRDELMRQYLDLVRENMEVRKKVEAGIRSANKNFVIAKAGMSEAALNTALMAPKQEVNLEAGEKNGGGKPTKGYCLMASCRDYRNHKKRPARTRFQPLY